MSDLVLSLFPGIGLLDMAFEQEGFCVVRGPDLLWGGDIKRFHPPSGKFEGVIGGPPCQAFSSLAFLVRANGHEPKFGNLIPEFVRIVEEALPSWYLMENVPRAPHPDVPGYQHRMVLLDNRWLGEEQSRLRRFTFGTADGRALNVETIALESAEWAAAVTGDMRVATNGARVRTKPGGGVCPHVGKLAPFSEMLRLQGLPDDFLADSPLTSRGKRQAVGNGVPLPMGRAIAKAVKAAITEAR